MHEVLAFFYGGALLRSLPSALDSAGDEPAGQEDHEPDWGDHQSGPSVIFKGQYNDHKREESENNPAHKRPAWDLELGCCMAFWELAAEDKVRREDQAPHHHEQHRRHGGNQRKGVNDAGAGVQDCQARDQARY